MALLILGDLLEVRVDAREPGRLKVGLRKLGNTLGVESIFEMLKGQSKLVPGRQLRPSSSSPVEERRTLRTVASSAPVVVD